jgi:hypothetical protein
MSHSQMTDADNSLPSTPEIRVSTFRNPFHPGHAKMGGRQAGVKNKPKPFNGLETARKLGFDPIEVMIQIVRHGSIVELDGRETPVEIDLRLQLLREVAPYIVSKTPTEIKGTVDHRHQVVDMTAIMMSPELSAAAQILALAIAEQERPEPLTFDVEMDED